MDVRDHNLGILSSWLRFTTTLSFSLKLDSPHVILLQQRYSTAFYYKNIRIEKHHLFSPLIFILLTSDGIFPLILKKCYDALVRAILRHIYRT
jgi:hypothetical protein